jgi:hypothetical protein
MSAHVLAESWGVASQPKMPFHATPRFSYVSMNQDWLGPPPPLL